MRRLRSGAKTAWFSASPNNPPPMMAMSTETKKLRPHVTLKTKATIAPKVTISPWAKLVSPVVPKISDRPTEQIARIRPRRAPSVSRWLRARSAGLPVVGHAFRLHR